MLSGACPTLHEAHTFQLWDGSPWPAVGWRRAWRGLVAYSACAAEAL